MPVTELPLQRTTFFTGRITVTVQKFLIVRAVLILGKSEVEVACSLLYLLLSPLCVCPASAAAGRSDSSRGTQPCGSSRLA